MASDYRYGVEMAQALARSLHLRPHQRDKRSPGYQGVLDLYFWQVSWQLETGKIKLFKATARRP